MLVDDTAVAASAVDVSFSPFRVAHVTFRLPPPS